MIQNAFILLILMMSCGTTPRAQSATTGTPRPSVTASPVLTGADQLDLVLPILSQKRVALVVNYTATVGKTHLVDTLRARGIHIQKILAPEHGFRGTVEAGELIKDGLDTKTGLPVVSLYGNNKKPTAEQLQDVDVVVFDIQDVGVRFFTYISTLHYIMEACAEQNKAVVVLDRPNPNSDYIDGPVLDMSQRSFVGMHPIPVVHGLTVGELARMINGEGWLANAVQCNLQVVPLKNWSHDQHYVLPIRPSPNLPNDQAIRLYPSVCLFEGTVISLGRGTQTPFQVIGHPDLKGMAYSFTPVSIPGMAKNPPHENKTCYGLDLRQVKVERQINLQYIRDLYQAYPDKEKFFINYFEKLAGNTILRQQIIQGMSEADIRASWAKDIAAYKIKRQPYLLYP